MQNRKCSRRNIIIFTFKIARNFVFWTSKHSKILTCIAFSCTNYTRGSFKAHLLLSTNISSVSPLSPKIRLCLKLWKIPLQVIAAAVTIAASTTSITLHLCYLCYSKYQNIAFLIILMRTIFTYHDGWVICKNCQSIKFSNCKAFLLHPKEVGRGTLWRN